LGRTHPDPGAFAKFTPTVGSKREIAKLWQREREIGLDVCVCMCGHMYVHICDIVLFMEGGD